MSKPEPVFIANDSPSKEKALFGFEDYGRTLAGLIAKKENKTPLVIGIYGSWGSGKTTLMETIRRLLGSDKFKDKQYYRKCKSVWFQAWKYGKEEEILAALIEEIFRTMKDDGFFQACKIKIEALVKRTKVSHIVNKLAKLGTGIDIADIFGDLKYKEKLGFYETFKEFFDRLVWDYLNWRPQVSRSEKLDDEKAALVVFIDDLDRCRDDRILEVLETIKLFMDKEGCIFVLGADNDIIEKALKLRYSEGDACNFMDKIVQVTFNLPRIAEKEFPAFINDIKIDPELKKEVAPHLNLILPAMRSNPRQVKHYLNNLSLQRGLIKSTGIDIALKHILLWNILDYRYQSLRKDISDNPSNLEFFQSKIKELESKVAGQERWNVPAEIIKQFNIPLSLKSFVQDKELTDIVKSFDITQAQLLQLITLQGIMESIPSKAEAERESRVDWESMVEIPAGEFLYGPQKKPAIIEQPFHIDIYPVTNAQFEKFMKASGYAMKEHWSNRGWEWREKNRVNKPRFWDNNDYNTADQPVVGVCYFEAEAYAKWAKKEVPTEKQWERAARGTDGREYPWGDKFDRDKCNTNESGHGKMTRVTLYPNGISPEGCYDMAGNVWEWTSSDEGETKVLRGGSWDSAPGVARCAYGYENDPGDRCYDLGIRCARIK